LPLATGDNDVRRLWFDAKGAEPTLLFKVPPSAREPLGKTGDVGRAVSLCTLWRLASF